MVYVFQADQFKAEIANSNDVVSQLQAELKHQHDTKHQVIAWIMLYIYMTSPDMHDTLHSYAHQLGYYIAFGGFLFVLV